LKLFLLDAAGVLAALALGVIVFYFGGAYGSSYLALMLVFLFLSVAATKYGSNVKRKLALYEYDRSWENVLANGIVPAFCVIAYQLATSSVLFLSPSSLVGAYMGSLAAVTADKFSSEIGVLGGTPRRLFDFKEVRTGQSGAVSQLGTFASFDGALIIGVAGYLLFAGRYDAWGVLFITLIGVFGSLVDSAVGVLENRGIGNKMTTNLVCALTGAALGYLFL